MLSTYVISVREFLEAFLIIGIFLGISRKLSLHREKEILTASVLGIFISVTLPVLVFSLGDRAAKIFTEKNADLIEGYFMIFSGFFIAYVVLTLHQMFAVKRSRHIIDVHEKLQKNIFDFSLFLTIVFFIIREGFEIALFTATTSLFSKFMENVEGLFAGFATSATIGLMTFATYVKFPISRVFKITEYMILLLGAAFVKNGLGILLENYWHVDLAIFLPIRLNFIPSGETSFVAHIAKNIFGLEQEFSVAKLAVMAIYIGAVYFLFIRRAKSMKA